MIMERIEFQHIMRDAEDRLRKAGIDSAAAEVEIIMESLLDLERVAVYLHGHKLMTPQVLKKFHKIIEKRITRYPLQYILGEMWFYGRRFIVNSDVMIPTPETETLCELAINYIKNEGLENPQVLDIGTGSGVIAVTLAAEIKNIWVTAVDISRDALTVARKNAAQHDVSGRINFLQSDLMDVLDDDIKFDLILSNPPYIAEKEYETLQPEVLHDPKQSLLAGLEGLDIIKRLIGEAPEFLNEGGQLIFEIGYDQADKVAEISARDERYKSYSLIKDLNDIDRVVILSV